MVLRLRGELVLKGTLIALAVIVVGLVTVILSMMITDLEDEAKKEGK